MCSFLPAKIEGKEMGGKGGGVVLFQHQPAQIR